MDICLWVREVLYIFFNVSCVAMPVSFVVVNEGAGLGGVSGCVDV